MNPPEFHRLTVTEVAPLTEDAVAIAFDTPESAGDSFRYLPGQHMVLRAMIDGEDVRRSYSICSNANQGKLRVGVKRLDGGAFSTYATTKLKAGDTIEAMPPIGEFVIEPDAATARHRCAMVAGSGITPVLSLVATTLESEPRSRWTLVCGNRRASSVMFLDEIEGLKDRYGSRLHLIHVLSQEETVPLLSGRIDGERLAGLFSALIDFGSVDEWFLCGPYDMVMTVRAFLEAHGAPADRLHDELFFAGPTPTTPGVPNLTGSVEFDFTLDGRASTVRLDPEQSLLDAALAVRPELPYSCKGGMCASCKALVIEGDVEMDKNYALTADDLDRRFTLTCQSHPISDRVVVDFDQR